MPNKMEYTRLTIIFKVFGDIFMQGYMVYAWDQYYPTTADKQVKGVFLDEVKAEALKKELEASGHYNYVECEPIPIVE